MDEIEIIHKMSNALKKSLRVKMNLEKKQEQYNEENFIK
jgi:hypothetical protein